MDGTPASLLRRYPTATATACFTLIALILTGPALLGRAALGPHCVLDWDPLYRVAPPPPLPTMGDQTLILIDFPRDYRVARGLQAGRLDLWNPLAGCGAPLWAEQGGPFFPLKLPFYLAPSRATYDLFLTLRLVIAALGAYLLARRRGLALVPAFAAGSTFELSGAMVAQTQFGAASATFLLPWVILGSYVIVEKRTARAAVAAGVALGVAGNGGHPSLVLLVFAAFGAAMFGHMLVSWRRPRDIFGIALCAGGAGALGLALAAPALLPLAELWTLAESYKSQVIGRWVRQSILIESRLNLSTALFPSTFLRTLAQLPDAYNFVSTIGVLTLVAAVAGMLRRRLDGALLCVAVLGVAIATEPPGLRWLYGLRPVGLIIPIYAWPLVLLVLTQSAGAGVQILSGARAWRTGVPSLAIYIVGAFSVLFALSKINVRAIGGAVALMVSTRAIDYLAGGLAGKGSIIPLVWPPALALMVYGLAFAVQRGLCRYGVAAALTALMALEQLTTMGPFLFQPASRVLATPPSRAVGFLQRHLANGDGRMLAVPYRVGHPLTPMLFGLPDLRGVSALAIGRYQDYLRAISREAGTFTIQHVPVTKSPLLDLAAVRYIILPTPRIIAASELGKRRLAVDHPPARNDPTMPRVYRDRSVFVYENLAALPRVRIVHANERVPDEAAAREWATAIGKHAEPASEIGAADTVVLEPDEDGHEAPDASAFGSPRETVRVIDQSDPDRFVIDVYLEHPGFVVIADTYYPGWRAWVDGTPTSIYPANLLFRAIFVPAGAHTVVLHYEPASFRVGRFLFGAAVMTAAFFLVRGSRGS